MKIVGLRRIRILLGLAALITISATACEGFRTFLAKVEQDRMQRLNTTENAPRASKEFLPYAIALEIRESWGDHLAEAFFATTTSR